MKRVTLAIVCIFVASPIFAQDIDLGLGGDASSLLNLPAPGRTSRGIPAPPVDRLVRLRELLAGANLPLTREQETALNAFLNAEMPAMRRALQEHVTGELVPEIIRLNDQLLGKMASAPSLNPEQQAFVKKLYEDQVKSRGGFEAIKLTLENAGVPFSAEQIAQIQPLFDENNQRETLANVIKLLTPKQRSALVAK